MADIISGIKFHSRRPDVLGIHGAVACGQVPAARIGIEILKAGGNAADAAVAIAAAMNVTQPNSTGLGGDAFCLYYDAKSKTVKGVNGSGRAPAALTLKKLYEDGFDSNNKIPVNHGHAVTVPGAAAAWVDTVSNFGSGKLSLQQILQPAIDLAEEGCPVAEVNSFFWDKGSEFLKNPKNTHGRDMLIDGEAPKMGQVFKNPKLAKTFKSIAEHGKAGFYEGRIAKAIVDAVQKFGGVMTLDDLKNHQTTLDTPISVNYKGCRVWEIPPNGQGIVALIALNILQGFDLKGMGHNSAQYLHTVTEALRLGFSDGLAYIADPSKASVNIDGMLSMKYAEERRKLIQSHKAMPDPCAGAPPVGDDTIYFTVTDLEGNACSFINSNYMGFGTAIVPEDCGFTLQNRGGNFSLQEGHPNVVAPNKRSYHTIIPAMITNAETGELMASYGVMGGFMQPQGHVQVLLNMLEFGMSPQMALDMPRLCIGSGHTGAIGCVNLEEGIPAEVCEKLRAMGHEIVYPVAGFGRSLFGRGHVITKGAWWLSKDDKSKMNDPAVWWAGSDPRTDGLAIAY